MFASYGTQKPDALFYLSCKELSWIISGMKCIIDWEKNQFLIGKYSK